jgi:hypothetical protein
MSVSYYRGMTRHRIAGGKNGLQMCRVVVNMSNKQLRTA